MDSTTASTSSLGTSSAAPSSRDNDSSMRFLHFSSPAGSVDGSTSAAFADGSNNASNASASSHAMYNHDEFGRSSFEGTSSSMHDDPAASHNYDRFMDKSQQHLQQQVKPWPYHHDLGGRVGRSNSFPSMDLMPYRKDALSSDLFGGTAAFPRHHHSHPSPSSHRGAAMASAVSNLPRSNSAVDMATYEVTHGIMNATSFPEIGNNDTQKQLRTKNIPSGVLFHSGRWSNDEHNRFVEGLHLFPHGVLNRWRKISKAVGTRTVLQTRTHAQKYFRKLQKMDDAGAVKVAPDLDEGGDSENHLPNDIGHYEKASSFVRPMMGSYGGSPSFQAKKEPSAAPPATSLFQHRMADAAFDAAPRAMMSADRHTNPSACYPFPTITIPAHHPSQQQSQSQHPTPTTEASRAFQNISLSGRGRDDPFQPQQPFNSQQPPQRQLNGPGNEQWVDWLLYNIDSIPTRQHPHQQHQHLNQPGRDDQQGRHHAAMTRSFRSASEPVPPLTSYRTSYASHVQHPHHDGGFPTHSPSPGPTAASWNMYGQEDGGRATSYYDDPLPNQLPTETKYSSLLNQQPTETKYSSLLDAP